MTQLFSPDDPGTDETPFSALQYVITRLLLGKATAALVKVLSVTNRGGVEPVGYVDVQPLVMQIDATGAAVPHGTLYRLPYSRLQGGTNAVIIDPEVNDLGVAVFLMRDSSRVKVTKAMAPPGSLRFMDWSDGCYVGGLLNGTPIQYVRFVPGGIDIVSPTKVTITAPNIELAGAVQQTGGGAVMFSGMTTAPSVVADTVSTTGGVGLGTHHHGGVQTGGGNTGGPSG